MEQPTAAGTDDNTITDRPCQDQLHAGCALDTGTASCCCACLQVVAVGTDDKACKELEKSFKERMTTAVCDAKDLKQVGLTLWDPGARFQGWLRVCDKMHSLKPSY